MLGGLLIFLFLIVGVALISHQFNNHKAIRIDLIKSYDWSHFAGSKKDSNRVKVYPLDRKIVRLDGETYQDNQPVNLAGPSLVYKGNFQLDMSVADFATGDNFEIYGSVPIVYDEWRFEPANLKLSPSKRGLSIECHSGNTAEPKVTQLSIADNQVKTLQIIAQGRNLWVGVNGSQPKNIGCRNVLKNGRVWFGAGNTSKSIWTLTALEATSFKKLGVLSGLTTSSTTQDIASLRALARLQNHKIKIGAAVSLNPLLTDNKYRNIAINQFSIWTPENELKTQFIHPARGVYSFTESDLLVDTALSNNIDIHGHALVFGEANPSWIKNSHPDQLESIMTEHITHVVKHFSGRINEWDVVNEPLSDDDKDYANGRDGMRRHIWYKAMGPGYVAKALNAAHQADPNAKLYINDYGLEADGQRWDTMIGLLKSLQSQGVSIDGVGFEAHVYENGDSINPTVLSRHIKQLADMGLKARISEIDVHGENPIWQAKQYADVLRACTEQPSCMSFTTWGISDKYGSTTDIGTYPLSLGDDLIWDKNFKPKPTYDYLVRVLGNVADRP